MSESFIALLQENERRVTNFLGNEMDVAIRIPLAAQFALAGKIFDALAFDQLKNRFKRPQKLSLLQWLTDFSSSTTLQYKLITQTSHLNN